MPSSGSGRVSILNYSKLFTFKENTDRDCLLKFSHPDNKMVPHNWWSLINCFTIVEVNCIKLNSHQGGQTMLKKIKYISLY